MMKRLKVNDKIPDFTLIDQHENPFQLEKHLGKSNLVVYFYPKDDTPGCTAEACQFRDQYEEFRDVSAEVIGISADTPTSHLAFAKKHRLTFTLLSDTDNRVRKMFGVQSDLFGLIPGRVTYVVDRKGVIQYIFNSQLNARKHVSEALRVLRETEIKGSATI